MADIMQKQQEEEYTLPLAVLHISKPFTCDA